MGLILAVIGAILAFAYFNGQINLAIVFVAIGSALSLATVEFTYVAKRVISPIYLADAILELILIAWWVLDIVVLRAPLP